MPQYLSCPHGHEWECEEEVDGDSAAPRNCPTCGASGETISDQPETLQHGVDEWKLPPPPKPVAKPWTHAQEETLAFENRPSVASRMPQFEDYEVLDELGRGGMGVVYKARQTSLDRLVALKTIITPDRDPQLIARLRNEAEAVAHLNHPNIAQIYEVGEASGTPYFAMEFVDGGSLSDRLQDRPLSAREAGWLLATLAKAMSYAHQRGVVHRDLKPANVLLRGRESRDEGRGQSGLSSGSRLSPLDLRPVVTDFGLAKRLDQDSNMTRDGSVMGTPSYMSPEQAAGRLNEIGPLSDVYGLGALLYDVLTGRPPFRAHNPIDTLRQVIDEEPVSLRVLNRKVPRDLDTICLKCLVKEPARRYESAEALADDLERFLNDEPIQARPIGFAGRSIRWCYRNPWIAGALATAAVFLFVALFGLLYGYVTASSALASSRDAEQRSDASFRDALDAVNNFYQRVSNDTLLNQPGMQPLKEQLLKDALGYYKRFLNQRKGDGKLTIELAQAQFYVGEIEAELGNLAESLESYQQALSILEPLFIQTDASGDVPVTLSDTWNGIGRASYRMGEFDDAYEAFSKTIELREQLALVDADNREYQRKLANAYMNIAAMERLRSNFQGALKQYEAAQQIRELLVATEPTSQIQQDLAKGYFNWANLCDEMQQIQSARERFQKAAGLFSDLLDQDSSNLVNQYQVALCYRRSGDLEEDVDAAQQRYQKARDWLEPLADQNPDVVQYQAELAAIYLKSGDILVDQSHLQDALRFYESAEGILRELAEVYTDDPDIATNRKIAQEKVRQTQKDLARSSTNPSS